MIMNRITDIFACVFAAVIMVSCGSFDIKETVVRILLYFLIIRMLQCLSILHL